MKLTVLIALLATVSASAVSAAPGSSPSTSKPSTVLDFYLLLPSSVIMPEDHHQMPRTERIQLLQEGGIVDRAHGYLKVPPGCCCTGFFEMCLFRRLDGSYVVAAHHSSGEDLEPSLTFFEYRNGKLHILRPASLGVMVREHAEYWLPRYGTTIRRNSGGLLV